MNFFENPFNLLGASARDNRQRLLELAEERSAHGDPDALARARADLTHPKKRLVSEVAWMPGVAPRRANEIIAALLQGRLAAMNLEGLPGLARANVLAAAMAQNAAGDSSEVASRVRELATLLDAVDVQKVQAAINEDRAVAGFPEVTDPDAMTEALGERRAYYKSVIKSALDQMPSRQVVALMTEIVASETDDGSKHAPALIEDLVDLYEIEAHRFLDLEAQNVEALVEAIGKAHDAGCTYESLNSAYSRLESVVRNWDSVAQPIQLIYQTRGLNHDASGRVGLTVRSLAIDLFNKHDLVEAPKRLTALLQEVFAEVPIILERTREDADHLANVERRSATSEADKLEWEKSIAYDVSLGTVFSDPLRMSGKGIEWEDELWPLEAITRVRWGGVRTSSGSRVEVEYTIAWGTATRLATVQTKDDRIYEEFIPKLWRAVGVRIFYSMLRTVREGNGFAVGDALVKEFGIELNRHGGPGEVSRELVPWSAMTVSTQNGAFHITKRDEPNSVFVILPYTSTDNVHILEEAIRRFFKNSEPRLSSLLDGGS